MQLTTDVEKFEEYQQILIREIIEQIRFKLAAVGMQGNELRETTGEIAFSVASTIDDMAKIEFEGTEIKPYLTFRTDDTQLIDCGENSYMNEFVSTLMNKVFN
ncbi:hypothetical protein [Sedimenticola sp.]|uniref:hypothetical protein n=1 Tax=Sedimenticola sp. TaxID=1940285 RepID=UPI003D0E1842